MSGSIYSTIQKFNDQDPDDNMTEEERALEQRIKSLEGKLEQEDEHRTVAQRVRDGTAQGDDAAKQDDASAVKQHDSLLAFFQLHPYNVNKTDEIAKNAGRAPKQVRLVGGRQIGGASSSDQGAGNHLYDIANFIDPESKYRPRWSEADLEVVTVAQKVQQRMDMEKLQLQAHDTKKRVDPVKAKEIRA